MTPAPDTQAPGLHDLATASRPDLLALWSALFGGRPPENMSRTILRRLLAFELQSRETGGLSAATRTALRRLRDGTERSSRPVLKPGGRYLRQWNGVTHVVEVVEGGYLWQGQSHRSLSAIAHAITGAHWSGPRFFGAPQAETAGRSARTGPSSRKSGPLSRREGAQ